MGSTTGEGETIFSICFLARLPKKLRGVGVGTDLFFWQRKTAQLHFGALSKDREGNKNLKTKLLACLPPKLRSGGVGTHPGFFFWHRITAHVHVSTFSKDRNRPLSRRPNRRWAPGPPNHQIGPPTAFGPPWKCAAKRGNSIPLDFRPLTLVTELA